MIILPTIIQINIYLIQINLTKHIDTIDEEVGNMFLIVQTNCFSYLASDASKRNISPIIIDNTITQAWETKPYVAIVNGIYFFFF